MNWDDLQVLLAVQRGGSRAGAARLLGVDKSTVTRRLAALECALSVVLTEPRSDGRLSVTAAGSRIAALAEAMEDRAQDVHAVARGAQAEVQSRVRLTMVPLLANRLILPEVSAFLEAHPRLGLELISDARDLSLAHHDADIALRLARPRTGGQAVLSRQIGTLDYAAYAAAGSQGPQPWIGYDRTMQYLSPAAAIAAASEQPGARRAALSVNDAETLYQAVLRGLGMSLFPRKIAGFDPALREVEGVGPFPQREVWLLVRRDLRDLRRMQMVIDWLDRIFS